MRFPKLIALNLLTLAFYSLKSQKTSDYVSRIDKFIQAQVELNNFNGAVLLARNDSILLEKGYGLADMEWNVPNTGDTKFRIASNTKQFTAISILQLEEQGKLSLDDTLGKFISGFKYGDIVTIRMLLTHSSGVKEFSTYFPFNELRPYYFSQDSLIKIFKGKPFDFYPGTGLSYSNTGYLLLGVIIEKASGQKYENYISQHILKPLGLHNTGVEYSGDSVLLKRARGYCRYPSGTYNSFNVNYQQGTLVSSGAMFSTVGDMYKFQKGFNSNLILTEASWKKLFTQYGYSIIKEARKNKNADTSLLKNTDPKLLHCGYGVFIDTFLNHRLIWTGGSISGFLSAMFRFPDDNISVIVLLNIEEQPLKFVEPFSRILFGADFTIPYKHKAVQIEPQLPNKYVGKWKGKAGGKNYDEEFIFEIFIKDNKLYRKLDLPENHIRYKNVPDVELVPESNTKFFYGNGRDNQFEFITDKKGNPSHFWYISQGFRYRFEKV